MKEITEKQQLLINNICRELDIEFNGTTRKEAASFIQNNIEEYRRTPTQKQIDFINKISSELGITFEGFTKEEAADFISENKDAYIEKTKYKKLELNYWGLALYRYFKEEL